MQQCDLEELIRQLNGESEAPPPTADDTALQVTEQFSVCNEQMGLVSYGHAYEEACELAGRHAATDGKPYYVVGAVAEFVPQPTPVNKREFFRVE